MTGLVFAKLSRPKKRAETLLKIRVKEASRDAVEDVETQEASRDAAEDPGQRSEQRRC